MEYPHLYGMKYGLYMDYKPRILSGMRIQVWSFPKSYGGTPKSSKSWMMMT